MAELEPPVSSQDEHAAESADKRVKLKKRGGQKSTDDRQKVRKYNDQDIDKIRIVELKDTLRRLNVSTTRNKSELQIRLRQGLARERWEKAGTFDKDAMTDDDEISDNKETMSESEKDVAAKKKKKRSASKN